MMRCRFLCPFLSAPRPTPNRRFEGTQYIFGWNFVAKFESAKQEWLENSWYQLQTTFQSTLITLNELTSILSLVLYAKTHRNLALGIGIQNFPEGLAVSLPLQSAGFSVWRSFWYGQLSGMVEPVFGVLGAVAVAAAQPALPYALAFAAGAMIYVVADDIIPEANASGNGKLATWGCIVGFMVMMCLDVGLG
ncbi:jg27244 [Pararge aegeria aegeria]|uniref:Zinc transporter ZIP11 n=1 Tax=Pararge aegeria aegeria TaxID=348720 RepID=A0A8S4RRE2_9NEOP|nr:jg27244 [Pararge aegeria aegeria]